MTEGQSYVEIDSLIAELEAAPYVDAVELYRSARAARAKRMVDLMFERAGTGSVTWGEISNAHPILMQDEDSFQNSLKIIKDDLNYQIGIFKHDLENYYENGDFPAPYYPKRIAIILRKQRQGDREFRFLRAYSRILTSKLESSVSNDLFPRAVKLGAWSDPITISWIDQDTGQSRKIEMRKYEIELGGTYESTLRRKFCNNPVSVSFSTKNSQGA